MHNDFRYFRRHLFTCTNVERNATPAPVANAQFHGNISFRARIGSHSFFFTVSFFTTGGCILSANNMFIQIDIIQWSKRFVDLHHFITEIVCIENSRRFHSRKGHELYQMILHHIPQRTCRFIAPASLLDTQIFYGCNFYVVNIVTIPERFEDTVGKTESQYILGCFLTEKMVDTVNLMLIEYRGIRFIQFKCRLEIIAERFLNDDARVGSVKSGSFQIEGHYSVK